MSAPERSEKPGRVCREPGGTGGSGVGLGRRGNGVQEVFLWVFSFFWGGGLLRGLGRGVCLFC